MWDEKKVRIKDIAEELGLSTATVSNVLHGKTNKISDSTVKAVEQKLEERGYIPNMAATLLARNDSRIIGVVVNDHTKYEGHVFEDSFIAAAVNHLSDEIETQGYFMMLKKAKRITEIVRFASMWNLDGVVIIGFCADEYQDLRDRIRVPFVIYDGFPDGQGLDTAAGSSTPESVTGRLQHFPRFGNIVIDDFDGGRQMGAYLKEMGHTHVLCIADNEICMDRLRYEGLCSGLGTKADFMKIPMHTAERGAFYREHLPVIMRHTAVFAVSDYYALELIRFLQKQGIAIPDEISVTGFDGSREALKASPPLTTVKQDNLLRATSAIALLMELIGGGTEIQTVCIPVSLCVGESVQRLTR